MDYKAFGIAGALTLVAGVLGYTAYQRSSKVSSSSPMDRTLVIRTLEELKHQLFAICLNYARVFGSATEEMRKKKIPQQTIVDYTQSQMVKIFQNKQKQTLQKYGISVGDFQVALSKTYAKDEEIQQYNESIETMLLDAAQGKAPAIVVPDQLRKQLKPSAALELYRDMQVAMLEIALSRFYEEVQSNKDFQIENQEHLVAFVREKLNMFKLKCQFVASHGPKVPSCNYDNFFKLVQSYRNESAQFKDKFSELEKLYDEFFNKIGQKVDFDQMRRRYDQVLQSVPAPLLKKSDLIQEAPHQEVKAKSPLKEQNVENQVQKAQQQTEASQPVVQSANDTKEGQQSQKPEQIHQAPEPVAGPVVHQPISAPITQSAENVKQPQNESIQQQQQVSKEGQEEKVQQANETTVQASVPATTQEAHEQVVQTQASTTATAAEEKPQGAETEKNDN